MLPRNEELGTTNYELLPDSLPSLLPVACCLLLTCNVSLYRYERRSSPALLIFGVACFIGVVLALGIYQVTRALPNPGATVTYPESSVLGEARRPVLPEAGASAVSVVGLGTLGQVGETAARPIASVTKMMTAYVILKEHPLQPGDSGPAVEITQHDADRYWEMVAQDQSVQPVSAGQVMTELQLLQGMMIPSANNYAEILAVWDAGSVEGLVSKMNREAQALGMNSTIYDDVSGFSSLTVSTAADQLILARAAMQNPVFAEIVGTAEFEVPGVGTVGNVNQLLGVSGIVGIKTGFTEEAGANLAFAARREAAGGQIEVTGIVMGQADYSAAFDATIATLNSLTNYLVPLRVVPAGQPVGRVDPPWGDAVDVVVAQDVTMLVWPGMTLETIVQYDEVPAGGQEGDQVGTLLVRLGEQEQRVPVVLAGDLPGAGFGYKLTRF
jgi:serine-type D-Ala-D-Ala carboxypeptidase (penicillin-binding protein 5/6)